MRQLSKIRGFTLIEVMSVLAVGSAVAMLGLPVVDDFNSKRVAAGVQDEFTSALALARSTAAATGQTVALCGTEDGERCSLGRWNNGWLVYVEDASTAGKANAMPAQRLHSVSLQQSKAHLAVLDEQSKPVEAIRFDSRGFNVAAQRIAASVCSSGEVKQLAAVTIERSGRVHAGGQAASAEQAARQAAICNS